ncbi:MAG: class I mannose-6-phosphate isomerase [Micromonosporaceae bacterium]
MTFAIGRMRGISGAPGTVILPTHLTHLGGRAPANERVAQGRGMRMTRPQLLPANQFEHVYLGGDRIAALRGGPGGPNRPEEWLGSTTVRFGQQEQGLSRLADGTLLRDAVAGEPAAWLGPVHLEAFGVSTEVLVKLLDPDQRLPVHVHPSRAFARRHLGLPHGKTEAWIVMETTPGARVRLGFRETMSRGDVRDLVDAEDSAGLVDLLRPHAVHAGDAVLVPAGTPHSIDAGILVLELQEPTDMSILLEWEGFAIDGETESHLGLGRDLALDALRLEELGDDELATLLIAGEQVPDSPLASLLPPAADPWFRADRVRSGDVRIDAGFAVLLVTEGEGALVAERGTRLELRGGDAAVVPWASGSWRLEGPLETMACRPPDPAAARGAA